MPTYRNDDPVNSYLVRNTDDVAVEVGPGETVATYEFLKTPFTETAITPIFNPVVASEQITLDTTGVVVTVNANAISIDITEITDSVTAIHTEAVTIMPPLMQNLTYVLGYIPTIDISKFKANIRKLVLKGSGTCRVNQYRV